MVLGTYLLFGSLDPQGTLDSQKLEHGHWRIHAGLSLFSRPWGWRVDA